MPTPRIDTLRNQTQATATLLDDISNLVHLLHDLAYSRSTAAERIRVRGGQPDYALDTHGDPKARAAYRRLGRTIDHACAQLATACHDTLRILNDGGQPGTNRHHPATIDVVEHVLAIDAQHRRIQAGEPDIRTRPQPRQAGTETAMAQRIRRLEADNTRLRRRLKTLGGQDDPSKTSPDMA